MQGLWWTGRIGGVCSISSKLAGAYLWLWKYYSYLFLLGQNTTTWGIYNPKKNLPCCVLLRMTVELRKSESCCVIHWSPGTLGSTLFNRSLERKETFQSRPRHGAWLYLRQCAPPLKDTFQKWLRAHAPQELRSKAMRVVHFYGNSGQATLFCLHEMMDNAFGNPMKPQHGATKAKYCDLV